jgi:predicted amidophosphoribosyltransferase
MDLLVLPALLVSLSAGAVWLVRKRLRRSSAPEARIAPDAAQRVQLEGEPSAQGLACPTCQRQYPPGLRFCPRDARALVSPDDWSVDAAASVTCGTCRRSFDPGTRFCPYDAEELSAMAVLPLTSASDGGRLPPKICPTCVERYDAEESFCARDGAELARVN